MPEIDCLTCAACCTANTSTRLADDEATFLFDGGTEMEHVAGSTDPDREDYILVSDCGYLSQPDDMGRRFCTVYEDVRRPAICADFVAGALACRVVRVMEGVESMGAVGVELGARVLDVQ